MSIYAFYIEQITTRVHDITSCIVSVGLKLFGKSYSGLEYDYRGLLHVYSKLDDFEKILEYTDTLTHWRELRDKHAQSEDPPIDLQKRPQPISAILTLFFSM